LVKALAACKSKKPSLVIAKLDRLSRDCGSLAISAHARWVLPAMRATEFPCIEDILYFIERETVMPNGLWYVDISVQPEPSTLIFEGEK
jgi:hypothetical protein